MTHGNLPFTSLITMLLNQNGFLESNNTGGTVSRLKVRLVAKGFHKTPGIDFLKIFSPVIKPQSIRTIFSLPTSNN